MKKQLSEFLAGLYAGDPTSFIDAVESHVRILSGKFKLGKTYRLKKVTANDFLHLCNYCSTTYSIFPADLKKARM